LVPPSTYNQNGIVLGLAQAVAQDVTLEVGAVTEEVRVVAAAPMRNTTNPNIGSDISERQVKELPLNRRTEFDYEIDLRVLSQ